MNESNIEIVFEPTKANSTRGTLIVKGPDGILHSDVIDIAKDKQRTAFLNKLQECCPAVDIDQTRKLVLAQVDQILQQENESDAQQATDMEVTRIARPHLFHEPEVSGLLVPVVRVSNGEPKGCWSLCVQWADGKKECRDLEQYITLPDSGRIWLAPKPVTPAITMSVGWSSDGQKRWLSGYEPSADDIIKNLTEALNYYLEFPTEEATGDLATLSLWVILTYVYPAWPAVPYLSIGGPLGSGKSRVFDVLSKLVYRPLMTSNMTAPCLFRTLDAQGGTLLLDEAERLRERSSEAGEIRSILLAGYKAGGKAHRMEKRGDSFQSVAFNVYGPKAIAGISELPPALASRCICLTMFKASASSPKPARRIDENPDRWKTLTDDLHSFALVAGRHIVSLAQKPVLCSGLSGREMEVWQPILALAKLVQEAGALGLVDLVQSHAKSCAVKAKQDTVPEQDEMLLRSLRELLDGESGGVTAGRVLEKAKEQEVSLFGFMSARGVGAVLKRYGIRSHAIGGRRLFRPSEAKLLAIQNSYGVDLGLNVIESPEKVAACAN